MAATQPMPVSGPWMARLRVGKEPCGGRTAPKSAASVPGLGVTVSTGPVSPAPGAQQVRPSCRDLANQCLGTPSAVRPLPGVEAAKHTDPPGCKGWAPCCPSRLMCTEKLCQLPTSRSRASSPPSQPDSPSLRSASP